MHHELAVQGNFYAFALTKPERLSLAVIFDEQTKRWGLYDLKGPFDAPADDSAGSIAKALLQRFQRALATSSA